MEGYNSESDLRNEIESLKRRRHKLGTPHNGDLKKLEQPIEYVLDNLDEGLDPLYALQLYDKAFNDGECKTSPIHDLLDGKEYDWEKAMSETQEEKEDPLDDLPSAEKIRNNPEVLENTEDEIIEDILSEDSTQYEKDTAYRITSNFTEHTNIDNYLDPSEGLGKAYQRWKKRFSKFVSRVNDIDGAAEQLTGGRHHKDEESIERLEELGGLFFQDSRRNPEEYKGLEVQFPSPNSALPYEMARHFLDEYKSEIEEIEDSIEQTEAEPQGFETTEVRRQIVDWEEFVDKPESEKEIIKEAAKFQEQTGIKVDSELLGTIVADANNAEIEYEDDIKGANRKPNVETTIGDIKSSINQSDELDFVLPVMEKEGELKRLSREIEKATNYLEVREDKIKRRKKQKP